MPIYHNMKSPFGFQELYFSMNVYSMSVSARI